MMMIVIVMMLVVKCFTHLSDDTILHVRAM